MKKALFRIGLFALVSAMALGCAKKDNSEPAPEGFKRTVQVTFTKEPETKTAIVEGTDKATYVWTEGDQQYFKVWENASLGTVEGIVYSSDMKTATLSMSFNTANASEYVYKARFANVFNSSGYMQIKPFQSPKATSYDPFADVMYADNITSSTAMTSLQFVLHRAITVNKMTLKGMTAGEKVNRVEITFNQNVTGWFVPDGASYTLDGNKITLTYAGVEVGTDGTFPVYFISAPAQGVALESLAVHTDQNEYNRTTFSKTYDFAIGTMARFGINMTGTATPVTASDIYTKVASTSDLAPGIYIIAASGYDKAMGVLSGTIHVEADVSKNGNTISLDNTSDVLILELAQNGTYWTIKNIKEGDTNYGKYIAWSSGNTSIEQESSFNWIITVTDGVATIKCVSDNSRTLQYNSSSPRFCCYSSTQKSVALYKKTSEAKTVGISFANESYELTKGTSQYNSFAGQAVTKESSDTRDVTYSISGAFIGTINPSDGTVELNGGTGTATVLASVGADATHSAGSVTYTITVNPPSAGYDLLDNGFIGVLGTTYDSKAGLIGSSGRGSVYSTNSAGGTESSGATIQLRSDKSTSGIVTTSSGGKVLRVELEWNSATVNGRTVQVYGKNTAYSDPSDLYNSSTQGTLIGELVKGSTTLNVTSDYQYIGIRSKSNPLYLNQIRVYWTDGSPSTDPIINVTSANPISVGKAGGTQIVSYSITHPVSGVSLTATPNVSWINNVTYSSSSVSFYVAAQEAGATSRYGTVTLEYSGAAPVQLGVSQEAGEGGAVAANGWLELPAQQTGSDYFNDYFKISTERNYSYMYQYSTFTCLWVAYPLYEDLMNSSGTILGPYTPSEVYSEETRGKTWAMNPHIAENKQINVWSASYNVIYGQTDYVNNAQQECGTNGDYYARGHQIPNGDRESNGDMQSQTYFATNVTPQIQNKFNGSIWGALETAVRDCIRNGKANDTIYVVTGAAFSKNGVPETITYIHPKGQPSASVPVPNYYWKVLLKVKRSGGTITDASAIGFWFEHKQYTNSDFSNSTYVKSVDQIEAMTGFNFYVNLPSALEASAEANTSWTAFQNFNK